MTTYVYMYNLNNIASHYILKSQLQKSWSPINEVMYVLPNHVFIVFGLKNKRTMNNNTVNLTGIVLKRLVDCFNCVIFVATLMSYVLYICTYIAICLRLS